MKTHLNLMLYRVTQDTHMGDAVPKGKVSVSLLELGVAFLSVPLPPKMKCTQHVHMCTFIQERMLNVDKNFTESN